MNQYYLRYNRPLRHIKHIALMHLFLRMEPILLLLPLKQKPFINQLKMLMIIRFNKKENYHGYGIISSNF